MIMAIQDNPLDVLIILNKEIKGNIPSDSVSLL